METTSHAEAWAVPPYSRCLLSARDQSTWFPSGAPVGLVLLLVPLHRRGNRGTASSGHTWGTGRSRGPRWSIPSSQAPNLGHSRPGLSLAPSLWRRRTLRNVSVTRESLIGPADVTWPSLSHSLWLRGWDVLIGQLGLWAHFYGTEGGDGDL